MTPLAKPDDSGSLIVEAGTSRPVTLVDGLSYDGLYVSGTPASDIVAALGNSSEKNSALSVVLSTRFPAPRFRPVRL